MHNAWWFNNRQYDRYIRIIRGQVILNLFPDFCSKKGYFFGITEKRFYIGEQSLKENVKK